MRVNARLVTHVLAMRPAAIDAVSGLAELHTMLVEVSQGHGGWGLYLQIEDENGDRLRL